MNDYTVDTVGGEYIVIAGKDNGGRPNRWSVVSRWAPAGNMRLEMTGFDTADDAQEYADARADYDVAVEMGDTAAIADAETRIVNTRERIIIR